MDKDKFTKYLNDKIVKLVMTPHELLKYEEQNILLSGALQTLNEIKTQVCQGKFDK